MRGHSAFKWQSTCLACTKSQMTPSATMKKKQKYSVKHQQSQSSSMEKGLQSKKQVGFFPRFQNLLSSLQKMMQCITLAECGGCKNYWQLSKVSEHAMTKNYLKVKWIMNSRCLCLSYYDVTVALVLNVQHCAYHHTTQH